MTKSIFSTILLLLTSYLSYGQHVEIYTWEDNNGDGLLNSPSEDACSIEEVQLRLIDSATGLDALNNSGQPLLPSFTSGNNPGYIFLDVAPGQYYVEFEIALLDYYFTLPDVTGANTDAFDVDDDSDAIISSDPNYGNSHLFTIDATTSTKRISAGFYRLFDIGDFVFNDVLGDGCHVGDPGIAGIELRLLKESPIGSLNFLAAIDINGNPISPQITDTTGSYLFTDLSPGNYRVQSTDPSGRRFLTDSDVCGGTTEATDGATDSDAIAIGDDITGFTHTIEIRSKTSSDKSGVDIGYYCKQQIGNQTWFDDNDDGIFDIQSEVGAYAIVLQLWRGGILLQEVISDNIGQYEFTEVQPGEDYQIIIPKTNWLIGASLVTHASSTPVFPIFPSVDNQNNGQGQEGGPISTELFDVRSCMGPKDDKDSDNRTNTTIDFGFVVSPCIPNVTPPIPEHTFYEHCNDGTENDAESNPICDLQLLDSFCMGMQADSTGANLDITCGTDDTDSIGYNTYWLSFVAGSPQIVLELIPRSCYIPGDSLNPNTGIQIGIYDSCPDDPDASTIWCQYQPFYNESVILDNLDISRLEASGQLYVPGQQYYLFVRGYNNSVCNLSINVIVGGNPPASIPMIKTNCEACTEVTPFEAYSTCTSLDSVTLEVNFSDVTTPDIDLHYLWEVKPPFGPYFDTDGDGWGEHFNNGTDMQGTLQPWVWTTPGMFTVRATATNGCDLELDSIKINVLDQAIEIFDDFYFCEQDLADGLLSQSDVNLSIDGNYSEALNPWLEDPNGDGDIGWQGGDFQSSSFYDSITGRPLGMPVTFEYQTTGGDACLYRQEISITMLATLISEPIDTAYCGSGQLIIQGDTISRPGPLQHLTSIASLTTGCDSINLLNVKRIELKDGSIQGDCADNEIRLSYQYDPSDIDFSLLTIDENGMQEDILPQNYLTEYLDSITYNWSDVQGTLLSTDREVIVSQSGSYSLKVIAWANGVSCQDEYDFVANDVVLDIPVEAGSWNLTACEQDTIEYAIVNNMNATAYQWTVPSEAVLLMGQGTSSIFVDWSNSSGGQVCVTAENNCGQSSPYCREVDVTSPPIASIVSSGVVCKDSILTVSYGAVIDPAMIFVWDFDGATIVNTANPDGAGPYELVWSDPGIYTVSLEVSINDCLTEATAQSIEVLEAPFADYNFLLDSSNVSFTNASTNALSFLWDFGDGVTTTEANPIHNYTQTGTYQVALVSSGTCGQDTLRQDVTVVLLSSIADETIFNNLSIFPNPSQDMFYINEDRAFQRSYTIEVYTIAGKRLKKIDLGDYSSIRLDMSNYADGVYLIKLATDDSFQFRKIHLIR